MSSARAAPRASQLNVRPSLLSYSSLVFPQLPVIAADPAPHAVLLDRFVDFVNSNPYGLRNVPERWPAVAPSGGHRLGLGAHVAKALTGGSPDRLPWHRSRAPKVPMPGPTAAAGRPCPDGAGRPPREVTPFPGRPAAVPQRTSLTFSPYIECGARNEGQASMTTSAARTAETLKARAAHRAQGDPAHEQSLVWEARLVVDPQDPVFFDHPLDHVPAMMLVEGALRLTERAVKVAGSGLRLYPGRAAFRFERFCELVPDPVVRVWSADEGSGTWCVEFRQGETLLGVGEVDWRAVPGGTAEDASQVAEGLEAEPVAPALVHRARTENVLIGGFEERLGCTGYRVRLLSPGPEHYFRRRSPETRSLGELIEGIRQFGILLAHEAREVELGRHFVVKGVEVDMERPVGRAEPLVLRSTNLPRQRGRGTGQLGFTIDAVDRPIGAALVSGTVVSSQAYRRIRGAAR